ncbi:MAG: hypothetical protein ACFFDN_47685 [Candidatus Hodarchaeota archaeon]
MSEDWMLAIQDIALELKKLNENIIKFLAFAEAKQPHLEYSKEEVLHQDTKTKTTQIATMEWEMEYEGKKYKKFSPCKYKCGFWSGWGKPYKQGDKILHINPATKEIIGFQCPKFEEG